MCTLECLETGEVFEEDVRWLYHHAMEEMRSRRFNGWVQKSWRLYDGKGKLIWSFDGGWKTPLEWIGLGRRAEHVFGQNGYKTMGEIHCYFAMTPPEKWGYALHNLGKKTAGNAKRIDDRYINWCFREEW